MSRFFNVIWIMYHDKATYMILGVENQTDINYAMPVKNIVYDVLQYGRSDLMMRQKLLMM